jgi:hypothetical protein
MVPSVPTRSAVADKLLLLVTVDAVSQEPEARTHLLSGLKELVVPICCQETGRQRRF